MREIELVGDDVGDLDLHFDVGNNFASRLGHGLWFSPLKSIQKLFFHTPLVYAFIWASAIYHDSIWWPIRGKAIQAQPRRETVWGQLFENYEPAPDASDFISAARGGSCGARVLPDQETGWRHD